MANLKLTGIGKNGGFLLSNKGPLDVRTVVTEYNHLADLVSGNRAYVGMLVYVNSTDETKGLYLCESNIDNGIWKLINLDAYDDTNIISLIDNKSDKTHNHSNEEIFPKQISMSGADSEICLGESDETTIQPGYIKLEYNNSIIFDTKNDYFAINNSEIITENRLENTLRETVYTKEETEDVVDNMLTNINSNLEENYVTKDDLRYISEEVTNHITDKTNPHEVTAEQIGLGNVLNVESYSKTESDELLKNYALKEELFSKNYDDLTNKPEIPSIDGLATEEYVTNAIAAIPEVDLKDYATKDDVRYAEEELTNSIDTHTKNKNNPHEITAEQIGLGNVLNVASYSKTENDELLKNYALKEELFSKSYNDLTDKPEIPDLTGYATEGYVDEEIKNELDKLAETIPSIEGLASEEFVADAIKNKVDDTTLENYYTKTEADTEFMTQAEVDSRVNEIISKASNTDTIKDLTSLVDYLDSHGTEASEMVAAITELETNKADNAEATQEVAGLMSAADKKKLDSIAEGADVNVADTDETITLVTDLYAYTTIGKISASNTNPKLVATAGSTLKTVFNTVFGTQQDEQPTIDVSGVSLSKSQGTTSFGGGEYGESISATTDTITFTLNNSATASYGYRCGNVKTVGSARFKYAITKQSNADIKITLPSGQTASSSMVTAGTYISHSGNVLYCNFNSSNQVKIKISLAAGNTTTNSQIRYETITGSVVLGEAWSNDGTTAKKIDKFLTYLKNDATTTSYYSGGNKDATTSHYTISAGYVPYGYTLTASLPSSLPTSGRSKSKPSSITVSGGNSSTYLYIFVPTDNSDITSLTASGFDVPFSKISSSTSLVVNNNKSATYKVFKTNDPVKADTFKL